MSKQIPGSTMTEKVKWKMLNSKTFEGEKDGYVISVVLGAALGSPYWAILKDGVIIDECFYHSPTKCELSARIQAEKCLDKLIEQNIKSETDTIK